MNVTKRLSVERLRAISDLDEKLVTIWSESGLTCRCVLLGTSSELIHRPHGVNWSRKIFEVMPKLASTRSLLKTCGWAPPAFAVAQAEPVHPGGSCVTPATTLFGLLSYKARLTSRLPGRKPSSSSATAV